MATSVFPKPTSPQIKRSIGKPAPRSSITSEMAVSWSSVSWYGKRAQNASHIPTVGSNMGAFRSARSAATRINFSAISRMRSFNFPFLACQAPPPKRSRKPSSCPYRDNNSMFSTGKNNFDLSAYSNLKHS